MTNHPNHGRVVLRPGDGVNGEDMLGVTLYDGEISMPVAEWRELAGRIWDACPNPVAKVRLAADDLRVGMICRMRGGGVRRIISVECGNHNFSDNPKQRSVMWELADGSPRKVRNGKAVGWYFASQVVEVISNG